MMKDKESKKKVELSLEELEEITGGYINQSMNFKNLLEEILKIDLPPILSGYFPM